jgi:AcrR family transcriptional regulator
LILLVVGYAVPAIEPSTKQQIICAAERLFAERGLEGVSMREIGVAAGNSNKSAVQYHFGSKEQLLQAIFEYRLPRLHERRSLLIAEKQPDDLRGWIECQVRAVLEQSELDDSHYMGLVAMLYEHGSRSGFESMANEYRDAANAYYDRLVSLLPDMPQILRSHRTVAAMAIMVQVAARRERARSAGHHVLPFGVELADLVDCMVGFLQATVSAATRSALNNSDAPAGDWVPFP